VLKLNLAGQKRPAFFLPLASYNDDRPGRPWELLAPTTHFQDEFYGG